MKTKTVLSPWRAMTLSKRLGKKKKGSPLDVIAPKAPKNNMANGYPMMMPEDGD